MGVSQVFGFFLEFLIIQYIGVYIGLLYFGKLPCRYLFGLGFRVLRFREEKPFLDPPALRYITAESSSISP